MWKHLHAAAVAAHTSFDMVLLLDSNENAPRLGAVDHCESQGSAGGALERNARSGALQAGASERESCAGGAVWSSVTGGIEAPTALESSAQAKHLSHAILPGVESCLWPATCARS